MKKPIMKDKKTAIKKEVVAGEQKKVATFMGLPGNMDLNKVSDQKSKGQQPQITKGPVDLKALRGQIKKLNKGNRSPL